MRRVPVPVPVTVTVTDRAQGADPQTGSLPDDTGPGEESAQFDVGIAGQRAGELDRVAFTAAQQAAGAERGGATWTMRTC